MVTLRRKVLSVLWLFGFKFLDHKDPNNHPVQGAVQYWLSIMPQMRREIPEDRSISSRRARRFELKSTSFTDAIINIL